MHFLYVTVPLPGWEGSAQGCQGTQHMEGTQAARVGCCGPRVQEGRPARLAEQGQGALVLNAWTSNSRVSHFLSLHLPPSLGSEQTERGPSNLRVNVALPEV